MMEEKKGIIKEFFILVPKAFTLSVLVMSIVGLFFGDTVQETTDLLDFAGMGLSYQIIFQILLFSIANSGMSVLITTVFKKLLLLWQMIITMFVCLAVSSIMAGVFRWIPIEYWQAWVWFAGSFVGCFVIIASVMVLKTKRDDKRLEKQLSDYKAKQEDKEQNP